MQNSEKLALWALTEWIMDATKNAREMSLGHFGDRRHRKSWQSGYIHVSLKLRKRIAENTGFCVLQCVTRVKQQPFILLLFFSVPADGEYWSFSSKLCTIQTTLNTSKMNNKLVGELS